MFDSDVDPPQELLDIGEGIGLQRPLDNIWKYITDASVFRGEDGVIIPLVVACECKQAKNVTLSEVAASSKHYMVGQCEECSRVFWATLSNNKPVPAPNDDLLDKILGQLVTIVKMDAKGPDNEELYDVVLRWPTDEETLGVQIISGFGLDEAQMVRNSLKNVIVTSIVSLGKHL
jgi:hypothetical protein